MSRIYTVREITGRIKAALEKEFPFLLVRGQVSNLSRPGSGHIYFTLKDEEAVLNVVWFRQCQPRSGAAVNPLTGEVLDGKENLAAGLANGADILCGGRLNVYPPRGQYQLMAELVQDMGFGRLYQEFEELKRRLSAEGFFDEARKRRIPAMPCRVAVVTSSAGAALRDFWRLSRDRGLSCQMRLYPTIVQGEGAAERIAQSIEQANAEGFGQVLVLIRGGGSLEDLWAFNTEIVARAVFRSAIPVVCGVGHEVDVSIADLVADLRVSTPSHAAQALWPERRVLDQELDELEVELGRNFARSLGVREELLFGMARALEWLSPWRRLAMAEERLGDAARRFGLEIGRLLAGKSRELAAWKSRLTLSLGADPLAAQRRETAELERRLDMAMQAHFRARLQIWQGQALALAALDPLRPLDRGYCLVRTGAGRPLTSAAQVAPGEGLDIRVRDGEVKTRVTDILTF